MSPTGLSFLFTCSSVRGRRCGLRRNARQNKFARWSNRGGKFLFAARQMTSLVKNSVPKIWRVGNLVERSVGRLYFMSVHRTTLSTCLRTNLPTTKSRKFVELVGRNPFLYDPSKDDHRDQQKMDNAWFRIAK